MAGVLRQGTKAAGSGLSSRLKLTCLQGRYNLSIPPPPAFPVGRNSGFEYLSAVHTLDEEERISFCAKYQIVWAPGSHMDVLGDLVTAAMKKFGVEAGCLSFFDKEQELVQIEGLHRRPRINREDSIAAHVLYSQEVMIVPDAQMVRGLFPACFSMLIS
jgi:hypothetical protein